MNTFADRLRQLRKEKHMSQFALSLDIEIPQCTIADYEQKYRNPRASTICKIADYFHVTTDYLLGRSDVRNVR
jgi:transcriptional regulator with XRE-family HTH domain